MATLTTPTQGLPYPDGAERVMDGDNAIGALALALDPLLNRSQRPPGVVVSGASYVQAGGSSVPLPLDTFVEGYSAMFDNPNDGIRLTGLGNSLWLVHATGTAMLPAAGGNISVALRVGLVGGGKSVFATQQIYQPIAAAATAWSVVGVASCPDNYIFQVWGGCTINVFPTWVVTRFGAVRLGTAYGIPNLLERAETTPAELEGAPA